MKIKYPILLLILFILPLSAEPVSLQKYYTYLNHYGDHFAKIGRHQQGEMEIITDLELAKSAQENYRDFFLERGVTEEKAEELSQLGIIAEDNRWMWIRDPLILPNGQMTGYNRFMPKSILKGGNPVSVLPLSEKKEILVLVIFRHATRNWEIEAPRGGCSLGESSSEAAVRELREETGFLPKQVQKLSSIAADSGIMSNTLDLFVATDLKYTETEREDEEAIMHCHFISKEELKDAFVRGYLDLDIDGNQIKAACQDAFLASALLIAEHQGIL